MDSLAFAIGVAVLAFCVGIPGLKLHVWLPEQHAPDRAREMIGAMTGLLGLLLALVLGTLVGSSYTLCATQKAELETLMARTLQLDSALEAYGQETKPARDGLHGAVKASFDKIWGGETADLASPVNATVVTTLALGAIAVASAIFLIIELSQPYAGLFRIPPGGLIETIQALGA